MVLGLMPVSRAACRCDTPSTKIRRLIFAHCATSRYMRGHLPSEGRRMRAGGQGVHATRERHRAMRLGVALPAQFLIVARGSVPGVA